MAVSTVFFFLLFCVCVSQRYSFRQLLSAYRYEFCMYFRLLSFITFIFLINSLLTSCVQHVFLYFRACMVKTYFAVYPLYLPSPSLPQIELLHFIRIVSFQYPLISSLAQNWQQHNDNSKQYFTLSLCKFIGVRICMLIEWFRLQLMHICRTLAGALSSIVSFQAPIRLFFDRLISNVYTSLCFFFSTLSSSVSSYTQSRCFSFVSVFLGGVQFVRFEICVLGLQERRENK